MVFIVTKMEHFDSFIKIWGGHLEGLFELGWYDPYYNWNGAYIL